MDVQLHAPAALLLGKRPGTHCIGGWMDSRAGLDGGGKSLPAGVRSAVSLAQRESLCRLRYPSLR